MTPVKATIHERSDSEQSDCIQCSTTFHCFWASKYVVQNGCWLTQCPWGPRHPFSFLFFSVSPRWWGEGGLR